MQAQAGPGQLITTFGGISSSDCPWDVSVSDAARPFHIAYKYSGTNFSGRLEADAPADWKAKAGWFVFIENNERIWAYDGGSSLTLLSVKLRQPSPSLTVYGSTPFPGAVPDAVLGRLTPEARKAIKK